MKSAHFLPVLHRFEGLALACVQEGDLIVVTDCGHHIRIAWVPAKEYVDTWGGNPEGTLVRPYVIQPADT